ncbi:glycolate dehydrogenase [Xanthomonas phage FoX2]|uniref:Glycolate dehydrogenase n=1 Tax=Xanthomonas phage FoX2 TaxID=2723898 RepID=A0A858NP92_9CAUD|nr:glycolate dehydrogenase [Xanthomonas phage FoX2]QJB21821.1 glycolate dehydrogenase [Xanthomonas phage FoX2]
MERREAIALGLKRYFTGKPCKRGHVAERQVSNFTCMECERDLQNARYARDGTLARVRRIKYYAENREACMAGMRARYAANPEKAAANVAAWRAANPEKRRAHHAKRRALKISAVPAEWSEFDAFVIEEAHAACKRRSELHGEPFHVDHMVPLTRGGLHCATNIQVIPARLNLRKGSRLWLTQPGEWIAHA